MPSQKSTIQRLTFDIQYSRRNDAQALQERISQLYRSRIESVLSTFFDERVPKDFVLKMDERLLLDLGDIPANLLEYELPRRLLQALEKSFPDLTRKGQPSGHEIAGYNAKLIPLAKGRLELLSLFLQTGSLPWWAQVKSIRYVEDAFSDLLTEDKRGLLELLVHLGKDQNVSRRIAFQFSVPLIHQTVHLLQPAESDFLIQFHDEFVALQKDERPLETATSDLDKELWAFMIQFIANQNSNAFDRTEFARRTLRMLASRYSVSYETLLSLLTEAVQPLSNSPIVGILQVTLEAIAETDIPSNFARKSKPDRSGAVSKTADQGFDILKAFLNENKSGSAIQRLNLQPFEIADQILRLLKNRRKETIALLRSAPARNWDSLLHSLPDAGTFASQLLELAQTAENERIAQITRRLEKVAGRVLKLSQDRISLLTQRISIAHALNMESFNEQEFIRYAIDALWQAEPGVMNTHSAEFLTEFGLPTGKQWLRNDTDHKNSETAGTNAGLRDLLRYFIVYGSLPWWGHSGEPTSIESLLQKLADSNADEAIQLITDAGSVKAWRDRIRLQFPSRQLLQILGRKQNQIHEALKHLQQNLDSAGTPVSEDELTYYALNFYWENPTVFNSKENFEGALKLGVMHQMLHDQSTNGTQKTTLAGMLSAGAQVLTNLLHSASTRSTDADWRRHLSILQHQDLYRAAVYYLNNGHWPQELIGADTLNPDELLAMLLFLLYEHQPVQFQTLIRNYAAQDSLTRLVPLLTLLSASAALDLFDAGSTEASATTSDRDSTDKQDEAVVRAEESLARIPAQFLRTKEQTLRSSTETARDLIAYFLTWHKLPPGLDTIKTEELLRAAGIALFLKDRQFLQSLLNDNYSRPEVLLQFVHLFRSSAGGTEKLFVEFLLPYEDKALRRFLLEKPMDDLRDYRKQKSLAPESGSSLTFPAPDESLKLLEQFLRTEIIPERWRSQTISVVVRTLTNYLFRSAPTALTELLNKGQHRSDTRMKLHDWITDAPAAEALSPGLAALMQRHLRNDATAFVRDETNLSDSNNHELWNELLHSIDGMAGPELRETLKPLLVYDASAQWIASQFSDIQFEALLQRIDKPESELLRQPFKELEQWLNLFALSRDEQDKLKRLLRQQQLNLHVEPSFTGGQEAFIPAFMKRLQNSHGTAFSKIVSAAQKWDSQARNVQSKVAGIAMASIAKLSGTASTIGSLPPTTNSIHEERKPAPMPELPPAPLLPPDFVPKGFPAEPLEKYYISNSGLVLLHPFITTLFAKTSLQEKGVFVNEDARARAVHLLQYLVAGTTSHEEHLLVLNKILCGMPVSTPLSLSFEPTESEMAIVEDLMKAVFQRWEKMRNSSLENFRNSFLIREGMLALSDQWTLKVEQRGYDILLTTLPWAFGVIKTPWMDKLMMVEWA